MTGNTKLDWERRSCYPLHQTGGAYSEYRLHVSAATTRHDGSGTGWGRAIETRALGGSLNSEPTTRAQMGDWLLQLRIDKKLRDESKSNTTHRTDPVGHWRECGRGDPVFASSEHCTLANAPVCGLSSVS